jgi:hypothetical protein
VFVLLVPLKKFTELEELTSFYKFPMIYTRSNDHESIVGIAEQ